MMHINILSSTTAIVALAIPLMLNASNRVVEPKRVTDTVYVREAPPRIDYDELARHVAARLHNEAKPTVIEGDLIVKGRLGVGGAPEPGTDYGITVRGPVTSSLRFISNEALKDPQRAGNQHRHVGTLSLAQDGGLRLDVNSTCFADSRGCTTEDRARRRSYTGYDSMGDYAFYMSDIDSAGVPTAPRSQSLVFSLIGEDGHIHIYAFRPTQQIYFNGSTATNAGDLQWQVPLAPIAPAR
jgi:hypothetical protein